MKRKGIISIVLLIVLVLNMGFVVAEAANPINLLVSKDRNGYKATISLAEDVDMQSFQFCLHYDGTKLKFVEEKVEFNHDFRSSYNHNRGAMLMAKNKDGAEHSSVLFLGVQSDESCSYVKKNMVIAELGFSFMQEDIGAVERALVLNNIKLTVEVLEGSKGELLEESERTVSVIYGTGLEHLNKKTFDENRYTEVGDSSDNNQIENNEQENINEVITDNSDITEKSDMEEDVVGSNNQTVENKSDEELMEHKDNPTKEQEEQDLEVIRTEENNKEENMNKSVEDIISDKKTSKADKLEGIQGKIIIGSIIGIIILFAGAGVFYCYKRKK